MDLSYISTFVYASSGPEETGYTALNVRPMLPLRCLLVRVNKQVFNRKCVSVSLHLQNSGYNRTPSLIAGNKANIRMNLLHHYLFKFGRHHG